MSKPRIHLHEDGRYISIGFDDTPDTLLIVPYGRLDASRTKRWVEAIKELIDREPAGEVYILWDNSPVEKGDSPQLIGVFDDMIAAEREKQRWIDVEEYEEDQLGIETREI